MPTVSITISGDTPTGITMTALADPYGNTPPGVTLPASFVAANGAWQFVFTGQASLYSYVCTINWRDGSSTQRADTVPGDSPGGRVHLGGLACPGSGGAKVSAASNGVQTFSDQDLLNLYRYALGSIASGQSYTIGGHTLTRADLSHVRDTISWLEQRIQNVAAAQSGGNVVLVQFQDPM